MICSDMECIVNKSKKEINKKNILGNFNHQIKLVR